jgi:hypothetical protein
VNRIPKWEIGTQLQCSKANGIHEHPFESIYLQIYEIGIFENQRGSKYDRRVGRAISKFKEIQRQYTKNSTLGRPVRRVVLDLEHASSNFQSLPRDHSKRSSRTVAPHHVFLLIVNQAQRGHTSYITADIGHPTQILFKKTSFSNDWLSLSLPRHYNRIPNKHWNSLLV